MISTRGKSIQASSLGKTQLKLVFKAKNTWALLPQRFQSKKLTSIQAFQGVETAEQLMPCNNQLAFLFQDANKTLSILVKIILIFKYEKHSIYYPPSSCFKLER